MSGQDWPSPTILNVSLSFYFNSKLGGAIIFLHQVLTCRQQHGETAQGDVSNMLLVALLWNVVVSPLPHISSFLSRAGEYLGEDNRRVYANTDDVYFVLFLPAACSCLCDCLALYLIGLLILIPSWEFSCLKFYCWTFFILGFISWAASLRRFRLAVRRFLVRSSRPPNTQTGIPLLLSAMIVFMCL